MNGIATRDLRQILAAAVELMRDPGMVDRMLAASERSERATERFREAEAELACVRAEHDRAIATERQQHEEWLRASRQQWLAEEQYARARLELDLADVARRRECVAAVEGRLPGRRNAKPAAEVAGEAEHGALSGCDPRIDNEQLPAA
jgi:hypothetical protein